PAAIQQVSLTEAIIELVKAGLGVSALARWAVQPYVDAGALSAVRLTQKGYRRQWRAVVLKDMAPVQYAKDFIELVAKRSPVAESPAATCWRDEPRRVARGAEEIAHAFARRQPRVRHRDDDRERRFVSRQRCIGVGRHVSHAGRATRARAVVLVRRRAEGEPRRHPQRRHV